MIAKQNLFLHFYLEAGIRRFLLKGIWGSFSFFFVSKFSPELTSMPILFYLLRNSGPDLTSFPIFLHFMWDATTTWLDKLCVGVCPVSERGPPATEGAHLTTMPWGWTLWGSFSRPKIPWCSNNGWAGWSWWNKGREIRHKVISRNACYTYFSTCRHDCHSYANLFPEPVAYIQVRNTKGLRKWM